MSGFGVLVSCGLLLAGCGKQSIVSPRSPQTHDIRTLWWWMLAVAMVVFLGALGMLVLAWVRRGTPGLPWVGTRETIPQALVLVFGIGIPLVILVTLFGVADVYLVRRTAAPNPKQTALTIDVIGHQWWWEVRYPGTDAVTANEIHIPVDTRVNVVATTADVIHSFWVPQLARKIDEVPGRQNRVLLYASQPGRYRGQCAEFCGFQHANMSLFVVAEPGSAYQAWLANMAAPVTKPGTPTARAGEQVFMANQCASCHMIRGTSAQGLIGPDLTHLASRRTLAGAEIRNTPTELRAWIADPQGIKPGSRMPDLGLSATEYDEIAAYLETLH
ncbi:MAG: cytochrome c oxidase subunit II [Solirubrobacterales bacterium]|nr:cytochrome c oxidase subunit II [Solirubrobacterales bacterium]